MRSIGDSSTNWNWTRSVDVSSDGKRNTTAITPERLCVPQLLRGQHLTRSSKRTPLCAP